MNVRLVGLLVVMVVIGGVYLVKRSGVEELDVLPTQEPVVRVSDARAVEALKAAGEACSEVKAARFDAVYEGAGAFVHSAPRMTGSVLVDAQAGTMRVKATIKNQENAEQTIEQATDGETVISVFHQQQMTVKGPYPFARPVIAQSARLIPAELGSPGAFRQELEGTLLYEGTEVIDGRNCDVVLALFRTGDKATRILIDREDKLPRRIERIANHFEGNENKDKTILTITDFTPLDAVAKGEFLPPQPEGYAVNELQPPPPPLPEGTPAPPWQLRDPEGRLVSLSELRGQVVVLDFWATWCGPCKIAMPGVQELHEEFADRNVRVYGVNCMEDEGADPDGYMKSQGYTYGLLLDGDEVARAYRVPGIPTFYVIDADGKIVYSAVGAGAEDILKKAVADAVSRRDS